MHKWLFIILRNNEAFDGRDNKEGMKTKLSNLNVKEDNLFRKLTMVARAEDQITFMALCDG